MASTLPTPLYIIQNSRYAKQDGWWLDDISLCSSGNIAVSGHNYRTCQSYVCIYGGNVDNSDSRDKPTLLYHRQFTDKLSWRRYISFLKPNSTEIVTCQNNDINVTNYNRDVIVRSRIVNSGTTCLSVSESQIFIGLVSDSVNIYDNDLNEIKSIILKGIIDDWPDEIAAAAGRLYLCTERYPGRAIVYSQDSNSIVTEYTTGKEYSNATSIAVYIELGMTAVLWYHHKTDQRRIIFYLLAENESFLNVNVESGVSTVRISDQGKIVTGNADTGEVKLYNLESLFSYSHLKESLVSRIGRDDCEKLADFFGMGRSELNTILKSDRPTGPLIFAFEENGVIQPSNLHRLKEAFLGLKMSPSLCHAVSMYQKFRDQITSYDRFLATLSAHLTSSVPAELCNYFHVSDEQKDSIISSQNPGLSLLLVLDEMGIIKSSEVGCLEEPFKKSRLVQALAKIDEYKEIVKEENRQLPQTTPHSLEEKRALFVEFLKKKIKSWYKAMTPVPWKKSCQWKSTDLFVGSGLILTNSKANQSVQKIDERCKLNYTEIFTHEKITSELRIILDGEPGAGKTMLSSQLAYDWSEDKIEGVDILIFLPLKIVEDKTLIQAVKKIYIPTNTPLSGNDIESILASDTERICLLLDGLEEYSAGGKIREKESSEVMKIMKKEKHSNCKVVITCRSDFAHNLPECPMLQLGRFGETERNSYIEKLYPHNTDKQQKIKRIIQDNLFILDLCRVPLLFVLAVHNIESMSLSNVGHLNKVSPFMRSMILTLCSSSVIKHEVDGKQSKFIESDKMTLGELAFNGLCKGHQQLSWQKDFMESNVGSFKVWVDSGILVLEEGLAITEKGNQNISEINKGGKIKKNTKKEKRQKTSNELPVFPGDMVTAAMNTSKPEHEVSKIEDQHQNVSELETGPHVIKKKTARRAADQVPITVKFLHKVIQEWFAATFFCSMMRRCTRDDQFQNCVASQLQHISPTDLHYVLRFTSYLHPPSCHVIMNYLLRSYPKDGSVPPYIINCVFLCFNEHNDIKGSDMRNAVIDVCKEVITIQSEDSRLLQQSKSALLEYASNDEVIIEKLELKDVIFAVDGTTLTLNSGVQLGILHTVKLIEVSRWDQVLQEDDYKNILKLLTSGTLSKEVCCNFPSQPPSSLDKITRKNIVSKNMKVKWHIGHIGYSFDPRKGAWVISVKQPGTSLPGISEVRAEQGSAKDEEEMQKPTTRSSPSTSTESSKYLHAQSTLKRTGSDLNIGVAVPEKKRKVFIEPAVRKVTQVLQAGTVSDREQKDVLEEIPVRSVDGRHFEENAIDLQQYAPDLGDVSSHLRGSAKHEEGMQEPTTSYLPSTSTESSKYPNIQSTLEGTGSDLNIGVAVPEKKSKINWNLKLKSEKENKKEEVLDLSEDSMLEKASTSYAEETFEEETLSQGVAQAFINDETAESDSEQKFWTVSPAGAHEHSQDTDCYYTQKTIKTEVGGTLQISDTGIMLVIPPNALPAGKEKYTIQLRYIPRRTVKGQSECFSSNSTTIAEILPNLSLQCPARLSLPHYLMLQQNVERKAKIFVSRHVKGNEPVWEEQKYVSYHVEDTDCIIMLNTFSWCTYLVDDTRVKAKTLVVYAAAVKPKKKDKTVRIEVGCYIDFPEKTMEIQGGQNLVITHKKILYFLKKEEKYPLQVCLNGSLKSEWECTFPSQSPDESTRFKDIDKEHLTGQDMGPYKGLKEVKETLTTEGKTFELPDTGIILEIPQKAFEQKDFPKSVGMRIIPSRKVGDEVISFCSNSSVAVELFPSGLKLLHPAKLHLPHCLIFKETKEREAKIFINQAKGSPSPWEEKKDIAYTLNDDDCIIWLHHLCCVKYAIYDEVVTGKKITVYTAAKKVAQSKKHAELEVGYYSDITDGGELLRMNPHFKVDAREKVIFMEDLKSPLQVSLERIGIKTWECIFPQEKQREISFKTIASSMEQSHLYILHNTNNGDESVHCIFRAWQKTHFRADLAITVNQQDDGNISQLKTGEGKRTSAEKLQRCFMFLKKNVAGDWKDLGRCLKSITEDDIIRLGTVHKDDIQESIYQILLIWKQRNGALAAPEILIGALKDIHRNDLAERLAAL